MQLWLATKKHDKIGLITRAASSDANLRPKLAALATEGYKESPGDEPIHITGEWDVCRIELPTDKESLIKLIDHGVEVASTIIDGYVMTYVVDGTGDVSKKRERR